MKASTSIRSFFFAPSSPRPLAVLRIGISGLLLLQAFFLAPNLSEFYGSNAIIQGDLNSYLAPPWTPQLSWIMQPLSSIGLSESHSLLGFFLFYLSALSALLLGWHTRCAAFASWLLHYMLLNSATLSNYGVDQFNHFTLFYFIWMPIAASCSLDKAAGRVNGACSITATLALRALQFHLCVVYIVAGVGKAKGAMWWNGEAMWRALMMPQYNQFDFSWLASAPIAAMLIGWLTLVVEIFYPIFIWPKKTRLWWVSAVVGLHIGIALFQGLHLFGAVMALLTAVAFGLSSDPKEQYLLGKTPEELQPRIPQLKAKLAAANAQWLIFYDGDCGFCNRFVHFVMARDGFKRFAFAPLGGKLAKDLLGEEGSQDLQSLVLLGEEALFKQAPAVLKICSELSGSIQYLRYFAAIPHPVLNLCYRSFAACRYLVSRFLPSTQCAVLSPAEKVRFFD